MSVIAIVPLKALATAKGRLADAMEPAQRQAFVAWMARRVLAACRACDDISDVLVVAGDEAAAVVAREAGVTVLVVPEPGLGIALRRADAATRDCDTTMVVAADLPEVTPADLRAVVAAAQGVQPAVVVAPTHDGGTGALLRRPPSVMHTAYGVGSAAAHLELARVAGVPATVVHRPGLAHDVDTPGQLPAALALVAQDDVGCRAR